MPVSTRVVLPAPFGPATIQNQGIVDQRFADVRQSVGDQGALSSIRTTLPSGRISTATPSVRAGTARPSACARRTACRAASANGSRSWRAIGSSISPTRGVSPAMSRRRPMAPGSTASMAFLRVGDASKRTVRTPRTSIWSRWPGPGFVRALIPRIVKVPNPGNVNLPAFLSSRTMASISLPAGKFSASPTVSAASRDAESLSCTVRRRELTFAIQQSSVTRATLRF